MIQEPIREIHELGSDIAELWCPPTAHPAMARRHMQQAGWSDAGRGYRMSRPRPEHGQLIVCYGGVGRVWVDRRWQTCREGFAYVSPPRAPSVYETIPRKRWKIAWILFDPEAFAPLRALDASSSFVTPVDPYPLRAAIEGLYREGVGSADRLLMEKWCELISEYASRILRPTADRDIDPLRELWAAVDARPAARWSIRVLADLAGVNPETLRVLCLRHVGRSPMQHVTYLRMQRATVLIQSTSTKIAVVSRMVGYENVFAFSTAFHRVCGVAPSARRSTRQTGPV